MKTEHTEAKLIIHDGTDVYECKGTWSILFIDSFLNTIDQLIPLSSSQTITINGEGISEFDSAGALALIQCMHQLKRNGGSIQLLHFHPKQLELIALLESKQESIDYIPTPPVTHTALYNLGKEAVYKLQQIDGLIILIGTLSNRFFAAVGNWKRFQIPSFISNIYSTGLQALPIIGLLSFLIGVVLAYQMGLQLESYGANNFIAYLSGMACFREFAPLITAIIVAGRTSSSFTAQIGSMKVSEEIDAILTMGLSPVELLVLPKLLGLMFVFPLLIFWADTFSILGAMFMSKLKLGVGYIDFLTRLNDTVGAKQMLLGLYKAPTFAILIALVGCFQGFNVQASSSSIGSQTTKSVVQALFLIIIADAAYSVIYSWLHL